MSKKAAKTGKKAPGLTAATANTHDLYEASVQNVEAEIDFVDKTFRKLRNRKARTIREDFCGTGNTSCEWVRRRDDNEAIGLDIDAATLEWGRQHKVSALTEDQAARVRLLEHNVLTPGDATGVDAVLAMNFSYWLFKTREALRAYFASARESLAADGVFFCDFYGGSEATSEMEERRKCSIKGKGKFTYVWDQHKYNPITGDMHCCIHFEFPDGTKQKNAFTYDWRLWTLPEIRELLIEAGFQDAVVYWEGEDEDGEGNGVFKPTTEGEADPAYICYIVARK
jgi:cyclopropane fatty-acyl-phospholipid synthase-like methyltransferase